MKISTYFVAFFLVLLISVQNFGGRYGSYAIFSWVWLLVSLCPLFFGILFNKKLSVKYLIYFTFLVFAILIQPTINEHPIYLLVGSLIVIIPFIFLELLSTKKDSESPRSSLRNEVIKSCKDLIGENKLEKCFEILLNEIDDERTKQHIIMLKQKWNQNQREKNMNLNSNEWLEIQNSKIVNELLSVLK